MSTHREHIEENKRLQAECDRLREENANLRIVIETRDDLIDRLRGAILNDDRPCGAALPP